MPLPVCCEGRAQPLTAPRRGLAPHSDTAVSTVLPHWSLPYSWTAAARGALLQGWVGLFPTAGAWSQTVSGRRAASSHGEQQRTQFVRLGSSLDQRYCLLSECRMRFPGLFVSCTWAWEAPTSAISLKWFLQKESHCFWGQWLKGCQCPGQGIINESEKTLPLLKQMRWSCRRVCTWTRGLGCTNCGERTASHSWISMVKVLFCTLSQLTGGNATSWEHMALWYKGWLYRRRRETFWS